MNKNTKEIEFGGGKFSSPIKVGAGILMEMNERPIQFIINDPLLCEMVLALLPKKERNKLDLREITPEQQRAEAFEAMLQDTAALSQAFKKVSIRKYTLCMLQALLTPLGDLTVEEAFNDATLEEVAAMSNFISESSSASKVSDSQTPGDLVVGKPVQKLKKVKIS